MNDIERALHEAHLKYQRSVLKPASQKETAIVPIPSEEVRSVRFKEPASRKWRSQHRDYRPQGYYRVFCAHDRLYVETCTQCHRDTREARRNMAKGLTT